jgi:transposase
MAQHSTEHSRESASAGIDVAKATLEVAVHGDTVTQQVGNDAAGHRALIAALGARGVRRVGLEASGPYSTAIAAGLVEAGFEVILFEPRQLLGYRRFRRRHAKNDRIDALLIAAAAAAEDGRRHAPDARLAPLAERLRLIEQLGADIARSKTRLESYGDAACRRALESAIAWLERRRKAALADLLARLRRQADLAQRFDLLLSIPGIGELSALTLVIRMPELGRMTRAEAAALAGVAPFDDDSGQRRGERHIAGGRAPLRRALYLAAFAGTRWNSALKETYERLTGGGKAHKIAVIACARKLLAIANAVLARGTPWSKERPAAKPA